MSNLEQMMLLLHLHLALPQVENLLPAVQVAVLKAVREAVLEAVLVLLGLDGVLIRIGLLEKAHHLAGVIKHDGYN